MIKYIGSKRKLITEVVNSISAVTPPGGLVVDLFSGTSRVGYALKKDAFSVHSNDYNAFSYTLADCYVVGNPETYAREAQMLIDELDSLAGNPGYFTQKFCIESRYFQPKNGERIDAIREAIEQKSLPPRLKSILLVSLMEAADRVDSTVGIQMAYLKSWAPRAHNDLQLRLPLLLPSTDSCTYSASQADAEVCASKVSCDTLYLDPPYNSHSYLGNYHIWESLVSWDKPDTYGVANKRVDCRERKSDFNFKRKSFGALEAVLSSADFKAAVMSYSDEGHIPIDELASLLGRFGDVDYQAIDYARHIGHKIGKYGPDGSKASSSTGRSRNTEYLFTLRRL
ncbi:MAG: DNA adenine methylase [Candidatus Thorarchaeota archaeon]|jgi:adenine-specific DNA-methyltransferase